ncbi:(d)CMP kinase [Pelagibaculum spongiae]|uniref:Cytidylate kinase n=1 Tax=Pelagibaculum spongiae TaxID=2080658 RepID=A0A2V1H5C9_9GAMM|nr:(d)CMP kinase [Pelagibaculum spongiae]PVZ71622.1 (d)CMP kinase [Pelagibaculum spongiae]
MTVPVITVDGPGGSGKGTLCQLLASELGFHLLDSGALYRISALAAVRAGLDKSQPEQLAAMAAKLEIAFLPGEVGEPTRVLMNGDDVTAEIRTEKTGEMASKIAALPQLRDALFQKQRDFQITPGLIADGRDMGTVVFPEAPLKIFLTASSEERAKRRYNQLKAKGLDVNLSALQRDIAERDLRDSQRATAPLKPAVDAVMLDSSTLSIEQVLEKALQLAKQRI